MKIRIKKNIKYKRQAFPPGEYQAYILASTDNPIEFAQKLIDSGEFKKYEIFNRATGVFPNLQTPKTVLMDINGKILVGLF